MLPDPYILSFTYTKAQKDACIKLEGFEFKLPHTGNELYKWSEDLHNCIFSYHPAITGQETVIYGLFRDNKIVYAVEVFENSISQAFGKYNDKVLPEDNKVIESWFDTILDIKDDSAIPF